MINAFRQLLIIVIVLLLCRNAVSQNPGYKSFKLESDNRPEIINTIYKDHQGYLYAGTNSGLYRFDGEKFSRVLFTNETYTDTVSTIFQDRQNKMWVGFQNGRIANIVNNKLVFLEPEEGSPKKRITAFLQDSENEVWFSTNGEGIYFFKNKRLYLINTDDGLSDNNVSSLVAVANGDILAGTDQGINICNYKAGKKNIRVIGPRQGLPDYIVTSITQSAGPKFWIGLQDKGFCEFDQASGKIIIPEVSNNWKYGQVNAMLQDQGSLWIATSDSGLLKYQPGISGIYKDPENLVSRDVKNLVKDEQGNIWLSTPENGLVRTPGGTLTLMPIPGAPVFEHVHAILYDRNNNIWFNNEWNELISIDRSKNSPVIRKVSLSGLGAKIDITSLYQDPQGFVWVGTMGKGIFLVDPVSLRFRPLNENPLFINASVLSITGKGDYIYVSSLQGSMEIRIESRNASLNNTYAYTNFINTDVGTSYVYNIFRDSRGRLWFATDGQGLTMLDNNVFTNYDKAKIRDERIYSITEDRKKNIWFSTANAGVYKFNGVSFINYGLAEGLSTLEISVLKTDNLGNIIVVNKKGLDIIESETGNISYLSAGQGIGTINAEDLGAVTTDTAGNIVISTKQGLLSFSSHADAMRHPKALIESVQLFLEDIGSRASNTFRYDENNFTFNYTGLYYTSPDRVYYQYKMEGLDSNWIQTKDRSKNFPKLAPGRYTFRIQAALNRNFKNAGEAVYSFRIKQAFYKTWWFFTCCALFLGALIFIYVRNREGTLKRIERVRQQRIQYQLEMLRNQVSPHFLFNSFNTLISAIEEDPEQAAEYAARLSDFFRNIVNQRDKESIALKEEISSLNAYFFLQQKRYGDNLKIHIDIPAILQSGNKIPPLTLQLLMENAIKHNAVSKETPLLITLSIEQEGYLAIKNNINPRSSKQVGEGMGLQNIINRYKLLTKKRVQVFDNGNEFIVSLPLLK